MPRVREFLLSANRDAAREMAERLLEAMERGLWRPRANAAFEDLAALRRCRDDRRTKAKTRSTAAPTRNRRKRKAARDKMMATKTIEKGLLIVHTGKGKGKSTAAFGLVMRALGHGFKVGIVQFVKGKWETGERSVLARFPELVTIKAMGEGFTWETQDRARDIAAAARRLGRGAGDDGRSLLSPRPAGRAQHRAALRLSADRRGGGEAARRAGPDLHVIVTGRNAKDELIAAADLVTEMTMIKHPFRDGVKAQAGIEF